MTKHLTTLLLMAALPLCLYAGRDKTAPDRLAALGTACLRQGNIAEAEHYYEQGYRQKRITTSIICLAGDIALAKNDREKADYYYGRAIYFDPRDTTGYLHYVRMHQASEPALAVVRLKQLAAYDVDSRVAHRIAHAWYVGNKVKEAAAAYDSIPADSLSRNELVDYAMSCYLLKDYAKSAAIAQRGKERSARDFIFNRLLMYNYTEQKDYGRAFEASVDFFERSERSHVADSIEAKGYTYLDYIYYGYILNGNGRYADGIAQFNRALQLNGERTDVLLAISKAYGNIGEYPEAIRYYKDYMEHLAEKERTAYVVYELGRLYYAQGTSTKTTTELTPEKTQALHLADETFAEVARMRPDSHLGCYWQARTNVALDPETSKGLAKPYYQRVIEMTEEKGGSQLTEAYKYLAYYYYVNKDRGSAQRYIDKILDIDPLDKYALQLQGAI